MQSRQQHKYIMCGIIGYIGNDLSTKRLVEGLYALEYRGYDSAGISAFTDDGTLVTVKAQGRLKNVEEKIKEHTELSASRCGIGHTRWATHGAPSDTNSHPHGTKNLMIVHNGIIENYVELKKELISDGYVFLSDTDTEVAALLMDKNYKICEGDKYKTIKKTLSEIKGAYAFAVLFSDDPDRIWATKKDSPLIIGKGRDENYVASDITAILRHTRDYYQITEGEIAIVERDKITIYGSDDKEIKKPINTAHWDVEAAERGGYPHFMIKEINEEPESIKKTVNPRIKDGLPCFADENIDMNIFREIERIHIIACGTAMHAGLAAKAFFESLCRISTQVEIASEFRYNDPIIGRGDLVVVISQSGETADSLAALRMSKEKGAHTLAIVNVMGSSIARDADNVLYTWAGPEIAVASTKAYTVQVALMALLAISAAHLRGNINEEKARALTKELSERVPETVSAVIAEEDKIKKSALKFMEASDLFFIGRGIDYALAMEGSLKLKEISYIHSEAYAAGELKHGTISLITDGMPVIAISTVSALYEKTLSNIKEVKARGAVVYSVCSKGAAGAISESADSFVIPDVDETLAILPAATVLQLIAYHVATERGCDVDKPRNLAKSVTVE